MRYICARARLLEEAQAYRYYLSELIRQQAQGRTFSTSWLEFVKPERVEHRDVDEIVEEVVSRAGITLEGVE